MAVTAEQFSDVDGLRAIVVNAPKRQLVALACAWFGLQTFVSIKRDCL